MKLEKVETQKLPEGLSDLMGLLSGSSLKSMDGLKAEIDMDDERKELDRLLGGKDSSKQLKPTGSFSLPKDFGDIKGKLVKAPVLPDFMKGLQGKW